MNRDGFSIAEALVSLALMLLVTGVVSNLVARSSHMLRFGDAQTERLEILTHCFNTMRAEVEGALELASPVSSTPSDSLELVQVAPSYAFPDPVYPSPVDWDWDAIDTISVRYALDEENLTRAVGEEVRVLAGGLSEFSAALTETGNVRIAVTILEDGGARTFSMVALRP